jgi:hypothetical protein
MTKRKRDRSRYNAAVKRHLTQRQAHFLAGQILQSRAPTDDR